METIVITNWNGAYTSFQNGRLDSGRSYSQVSAGQNPFLQPGTLTWSNTPIQINPSENIITDMILAGKERVEGNILYVYAIGHTGRLYKIQVNDPSSYNPDYDNPVLLATLSSNSPTFTRGGFIDFYGSTQQIYIGSDMGVTAINFDGTGETFVGSLGQWSQNVPRPLEQFLGNLYAGNGANIAQITVSATVSNYGILSPGFPSNTQVRDMDVSPDGNYLEIVVNQLPLYDITSAVQETSTTSNSQGYLFKWNGTDLGYTSYVTYPTFSLTSNINFQNYQYIFGYDQFGSAVFAPSTKIITGGNNLSPLPNAVLSSGNLVMWASPTYFNGVMELDYFCWGSLDFEVGHPLGYWDLFFINAKSPQTDIILCPFQMSVSNAGIGSSSNGYPSNVFGTSKIYFSTLETNNAPSAKYRLYKWNPNSSPDIPSMTPIMNAIYQTQTQLFSKKIRVSDVRIYAEPWKAGNSLQFDLIGSNGLPMTDGTKIFTAQNTNSASPMFIGTDYAWWTPQGSPTYALGIALTNLGTTNAVINKVEIDYKEAGK